MSIRIGIDTGGTFTDVVAFNESTGELHATKTPSIPSNPARAFVEGIRLILEKATLEPDQISTVSHGTTVATNALLEDNMSGLGLITTQGFRHVLEIARQSVPDGYGNSYFWVKPDRIVPLHLVHEISERLDARGQVVRELDENSVATAARYLRDQGVRSIGVCLLHSYLNSDHEERVEEIISRVYPEATISISSRVLREYREYERSVTTLVDAFVKEKVVRYISSINAQLELISDNEPPAFYVMKSNGGIISSEAVGAQPITTVLSGPAAGALGAAEVARYAGFQQVLALDGGGTSTDVTVVQGAEPALTTEGSIGRHPIKVPMIDIVTVGTGGGSIARVSPEGGLKVGPQSAGATPGPLCYDTGGTAPTVTDAHLVLGRIPSSLIGGGIELNHGKAAEGLEVLAADLGLTVEECASGVLEIAAWNQANAIRQVTVRRGLDVRDFALCGFGGSGPLQACRLLDLLGLEAAVVPPDPGNLSAYGLLVVDLRHDEVQTIGQSHGEISESTLGEVFSEIEQRASTALETQGYGKERQRIARWVDLRYEGQAFEVQTNAPGGPVDDGFVAKVLANFHDEHERLYGYCYRDRPEVVVEWINLRVTSFGPIERPNPRQIEAGTGAVETQRRKVYFGEWSEVPIYDRSQLGQGDSIQGPAVIEEFGSTTPIAPNFETVVDHLGNLIIKPSTLERGST
ncbi:MAG: hydantoinase/oxoprolinase family protein [Actinomycetota bacterium]|nr:hydantoinase/oxoprolinase family protein [Actinomycetota bacterium]